MFLILDVVKQVYAMWKRFQSNEIEALRKLENMGVDAYLWRTWVEFNYNAFFGAWYDFFYTDLMTGMRRGEICGLKWTDFDAEHGKLHVQRTIRYQHGQPVIGETKTSEGNRKIVLPSSVAELLKEAE